MKKLILLLFSLFLTINCSRDNDESSERFVAVLPQETQKGANTFGCFIDDFLFVPRDGNPLVYNQNGVCLNKGISMEGDYYNSDNTLSHRDFEINNYRDNNYSIGFQLPNFPDMQASEFDFGNSVYEDKIVIIVTFFDNKTNKRYFFRSNNYSGKLIITRKDNHIFSGTFSGILKEIEGTKEIKLTNGVFDFDLTSVNTHIYP